MAKFSHRVDYRLSSSDAEVDQLLYPANFYARPADVLADQLLTIDERRAILSSWASDACAVESNPTLRKPPLVQAPVRFDEIMDALRQLDTLRGTMGISPVNMRRRGSQEYSCLAYGRQQFQPSAAR